MKRLWISFCLEITAPVFRWLSQKFYHPEIVTGSFYCILCRYMFTEVENNWTVQKNQKVYFDFSVPNSCTQINHCVPHWIFLLITACVNSTYNFLFWINIFHVVFCLCTEQICMLGWNLIEILRLVDFGSVFEFLFILLYFFYLSTCTWS